MSDEFNKIESLLGQAKEYVNTRIAQFKLSVAEKVSKIMATVIAGLAAALVFFLFLVFAGIAAAIALGQWTGSMWLGFLIVAIIYLFLSFILWKGKDRLLALPIMNAIIGHLFDEEEEKDEKD
ncbi:MAG: phage holin family protein [Chitinophagaceae bacterium]|nr:phage holin family protein [Chitinophagaceae bacterium]